MLLVRLVKIASFVTTPGGLRSLGRPAVPRTGLDLYRITVYRLTEQAVAMPDADAYVPLSPQVFQILLSLIDEPRHGYAVIVDVDARTNGEVRLTASTLYDALSRLVDDGLIEETSGPVPQGVSRADARRRYYALTPLGRQVARAEARRLERLVAMARGKRLLGRR